MSQNVFPLKAVKDLEPRVNIDKERLWAVSEGGREVSYKSVKSTSVSNSSVQISAPPPSPYTIVDRRIYMRYRVDITFNAVATAANQRILSTGVDAFRAFPLSNCMETLTVSINNTNVSINMRDTLDPLLRYNSDEMLRNRYWSCCPSALDQSQEYSALFGTNMNPLGSYFDTIQDNQQPRGSFQLIGLNNGPSVGAGAFSATLSAIITEPLFLSPFIWEKMEKSGFYGVQTLDFNLTFSNLARMWSRDTVNQSLALTSISVDLQTPKDFSLLFCYITPKETMKLPESVTYPYYNVDRYPTDFSSADVPHTATSATTINSQNIQLNSVPHRMYIYARRRNTDLTSNTGYQYTDSYFGIENISIQFANRSGLLSSATKQDLYKMSVKNGCSMSYQQWSGERIFNLSTAPAVVGSGLPPSANGFGTVGSVLALDFGDDIGLDSSLAPGVLGTYQLQMSVGIRNYASSSFDGSLYIVIVSAGSITIFDNRAVTQIGVISRDDVLNAALSEESYKPDNDNIYGGNFFSKVKGFFKKAKKGYDEYVRPALPLLESGAMAIAPEYAPAIQKEQQIRKALGLGVIGGASVGGMKMSKAQMQKRLGYTKKQK